VIDKPLAEENVLKSCNGDPEQRQTVREMILTENHKDAFSELINIAFSRSAAALCELTGYRFTLNAPLIALRPIRELHSSLSELGTGEVVWVQQIFTGPVSGNTIFMLNYEGANILADLLTGGEPGRDKLEVSNREVLMETGNILINACLGVFGNLLGIHVTFSVPRIHLENLNSMLDSLVIGMDEPRYALIIHTTFQFRSSAVNGYLIIVLGFPSLGRLLPALDERSRAKPTNTGR